MFGNTFDRKQTSTQNFSSKYLKIIKVEKEDYLTVFGTKHL